MKLRLLSVFALLALVAVQAGAETRVTYKSAKAASSYYQMAVQIAEAVKAATDGDIILTVEESQGSVQNVKEATHRSAHYVFTTPPGLIEKAVRGEEPFTEDPAYGEIRALFPIPALTMHFVVRADAGIHDFVDLADKDFIIGKGSFSAEQAEAVFTAAGVIDKINLVDVELNAAVPALQDDKVAGFATAGSYPAPNVMQAAAGTAIRLLNISDSLLEQVQGERSVIPAGTYPGVDYPVKTLSLPVGAYTLAAMDEETAYKLTQAYWEKTAAMAEANPWWQSVVPEMVTSLEVSLHPGALRYYQEAGIEVPKRLQ